MLDACEVWHITVWASDWHLKWLMDISVMDARLSLENMFLLIRKCPATHIYHLILVTLKSNYSIILLSGTGSWQFDRANKTKWTELKFQFSSVASKACTKRLNWTELKCQFSCVALTVQSERTGRSFQFISVYITKCREQVQFISVT